MPLLIVVFPAWIPGICLDASMMSIPIFSGCSLVVLHPFPGGLCFILHTLVFADVVVMSLNSMITPSAPFCVFLIPTSTGSWYSFWNCIVSHCSLVLVIVVVSPIFVVSWSVRRLAIVSSFLGVVFICPCCVSLYCCPRLVGYVVYS